VARAYYLRGEARLSLGDNRGAEADFTTVVGVDPTNAGAYYNRGLARSRLGEKQGSGADYRTAAALYKRQGNQTAYNRAQKNSAKIAH